MPISVKPIKIYAAQLNKLTSPIDTSLLYKIFKMMKLDKLAIANTQPQRRNIFAVSLKFNLKLAIALLMMLKLSSGVKSIFSIFQIVNYII